MSGNSIRSKGVFLFDTPTIETLKSCSLFWKNIVVFESYLSDVVEYPELVEVSQVLFEKDILKICHSPDDLKSALWDKIYATLDIDLREYLYKNAEKVTIMPELPKDAKKIISESTERDYRDTNLQFLIDSIIRYNIDDKWFESLLENERISFDQLPEEFQQKIFTQVKKMADIEYEYYQKRDGPVRYGFEERNQILLEQTSVSSALYTPSSWLSYYQYKLGDYQVRDAKRYLQGLDAIVPFVKQESINGYTIDEVIDIRQNKRWNNAMNRLGDLCIEAKYSFNTQQYIEEIKNNIIFEYQDALGEEEITPKDLTTNLTENCLVNGISFIPIIGPPISTAVGFLDPIIKYLFKERSQRTLPFFLNDLKKRRN